MAHAEPKACFELMHVRAPYRPLPLVQVPIQTPQQDFRPNDQKK